MDQHIFCGQWSAQFRQVLQPVGMDNEAVEGVAHAASTGLCIVHDVASDGDVALIVEVAVHHSGPGLYHRDLRRVANEVDQSLAASGNTEVYVVHGPQHLTGSFVGGGQQGHDIRVDAQLAQHLTDEVHPRLAGVYGIFPTFQDTGVATFQA